MSENVTAKYTVKWNAEKVARFNALLAKIAARAAHPLTETRDDGCWHDGVKYSCSVPDLRVAWKRIAELESKLASAEEQVSELLAMIEHPRVRQIVDEIAASAIPKKES